MTFPCDASSSVMDIYCCPPRACLPAALASQPRTMLPTAAASLGTVGSAYRAPRLAEYLRAPKPSVSRDGATPQRWSSPELGTTPPRSSDSRACNNIFGWPPSPPPGCSQRVVDAHLRGWEMGGGMVGEWVDCQPSRPSRQRCSLPHHCAIANVPPLLHTTPTESPGEGKRQWGVRVRHGEWVG